MANEAENGHHQHQRGAPLGWDYTLCECELVPLQRIVTALEGSYQVSVRKQPSICLTMIPAEDSLEHQRFYLGEALTTECEVTVGGSIGYGLCLGDDRVRAYCLAIVDALMHTDAQVPTILENFLREQAVVVGRRDQDEFDLILQTKVDFKLMEEA